MPKLNTRVAADNIPEELMKRLMGTAERDMLSVSDIVRKSLNESLPPLQQVKKFYHVSAQKYNKPGGKEDAGA